MPSIFKSMTVILLSNRWVRTHTFTPPLPPINRLIPTYQLTSKKIIDAEFTHIDTSDDKSAKEVKQMTLIEYSQDQDPEWKSMPIAFCDLQSQTYIDCTLAFYVKGTNGEEYCLGVPCEVPLVVGVEIDGEDENAQVTNLAKVLPINPDANEIPGCYKIGDDEKREVFETAARILSDEFGKNIRLKKTPRVLTVQGDLDEIIGDWKEALLGASRTEKGRMKRPDIEEALKILDEDEEEGEKYFDMIMRRDLGDDYMKLIEDDDNDLDDDILKLFDVNAEDLEEGDMEEFLKFMSDSVDHSHFDAKKSFDELLRELKPSAALRLFSFVGPNEKQFTILRPLRPLLLVGKEDPADYTKRILLSEDEKKAILPELERVCKSALEEAGFFLSGSEEVNK